MKQYAIDVYLSYGVHHSDMAADKPINFAEHVQLQELGIAAESISFANVTLESEKYVCVRESGSRATPWRLSTSTISTTWSGDP